MSALDVLVPTRGRPQNVSRLVDAFIETGAFEQGAYLIFIVDMDDPEYFAYMREIKESPLYGTSVDFSLQRVWSPLVPKLNQEALSLALLGDTPLAFMGDDHLPRTENWVETVVSALGESPRIVSSPDGFRSDDLPTWWAMSPDVVRALGGMVPAPVEHLYCDNSVRDVAQGAGVYLWLEDVLIEHMHPFAGKAESDAGYSAVNSRERYNADMSTYAIWTFRHMRRDIAKIRALKEAPRE